MIRVKRINRFFSEIQSKINFKYFNNNCMITLNHDKSLNALDLDITNKLKLEFQKWEDSLNFPKILILGSNEGSKAFCAGGDIKAILQLKKDNQSPEKLMEFFKEEYIIQYYLANLESKGVVTVAFWDGIVMGGGVGLSLRATHRLATEKTVFAMPENVIGLFPDIGFSYNVQSISKGLSRALMLGGLKIKAEETVYSSLATNLIKSEQVPLIKKEIIEVNELDIKLRNLKIKKILSKYNNDDYLKEKNINFKEKLRLLENSLSGSSLEECINNIRKNNQNETMSLINKNIDISSPLSLKITWELLNRKCDSLKHAYTRDYELVKYFLEQPDFYSGVQTLLIDKSKNIPKWSYGSINEIGVEKINRIFNGELTKYKTNLLL